MHVILLAEELQAMQLGIDKLCFLRLPIGLILFVSVTNELLRACYRVLRVMQCGLLIVDLQVRYSSSSAKLQ